MLVTITYIPKIRNDADANIPNAIRSFRKFFGIRYHVVYSRIDRNILFPCGGIDTTNITVRRCCTCQRIQFLNALNTFFDSLLCFVALCPKLNCRIHSNNTLIIRLLRMQSTSGAAHGNQYNSYAYVVGIPF